MKKQVAPTYSSWNLCSFPPYPTGAHYVVTECTNESTLITDRRIVVDYGIQDIHDQVTAATAQREASRRNQESFDLYIKDRAFDRFIIGHSYVTVNESDVARLAGIFNTPPNQVQITRDLKILHRTCTWIFWSDGRFTTSIGCTLPSGGSLSPDAIALISAIRDSDGSGCNLPGGLQKLAQVAKILSEEDVMTGPSRGHYASERIQRISIEWNDGTTGELFVHTAGYFEGYLFDIYPSLEALNAQKSPAPGPEGIDVFPPDDYSYDPVLGYVAIQDD